MEHILHDILSYNPFLEEIAFQDVDLEPFVLENVCFTRLRVLRVTNMDCVGKEFCHAMRQLCDGLTHLCLSEANLASPELIIDLTKQYGRLRSLDLTDTNVNGAGMAAVVLSCPLIANLSLKQCSLVDDDSILSIAQGLQELRTLDIRDCAQLTDNSIKHLTNNCAAQFRVLYLGCTFVHLITVVALLRKCCGLHTLGLEVSDDVRYADIDLCDVFTALQQIQRLHLHGAGLIADNVLRLVGHYCKNLTHLELRPIWEPLEPVHYFSAQGLFALQEGCPKLQKLIVFEECTLLHQELAIMLWQVLRPGLVITCKDTIDYDAMKYDV